ncbi:MAG: internalization-related competence protein ComEC/Rec2 protein [Parcubacteria group bacterium GW2011_GWC2_42_13]|nr:MAG: internalization-related competence protein ComEC/Rec2 protein [Parcubacteria group bacterium GW2011_GWC2_42_13]
MAGKLFSLFWLAVLVAVLIFIFRLEQALSPQDRLRQFRDTGKIFQFEGIVVGEPDKRLDNTKLKVRLLPYSEYVLITIGSYQEYFYGDKLKLKGKLQTPKEFEDFNYKNYLRKDKILSVMYEPKIEVIGKSDLLEEVGLPRFYANILEIKEKLRISIYRSLASPQAELLAAMVLGDQSRLSQELKNNFSRTGITHIVAISGMNITIMAEILIFFFGLTLRLGWNRAFYLVLFITVFYVVMIGAPASAVRAGIMAGVLLLAQKTGRLYFAGRALLIAAAIMLIFNPLLLFYDVGFQLSFLAVLGIIYLFPIFDFHLSHFLKNKGSRWFRQILALTLSAQIFTLPILVYNFGSVSLISPLVNVLVVPLLPVILIFGFLGILAGLFGQFLGMMFSFPVFGILSYILEVSRVFGNFAFSGFLCLSFLGCEKAEKIGRIRNVLGL